jgi:hypothetical protein
MAFISTEEVREIRNELKYRFRNQLKFSVKKDHHSSVNVTIKSGTIDFSEILGEREYTTINQYALNQTGEHSYLLNEIIDIIKTAPGKAENGREWYDNSDSMTDYFDTAFYFHLKIGDYEQPYQFTGTKKQSKSSKGKFSIKDKNRSGDISNQRFTSFEESEKAARMANSQTGGNYQVVEKDDNGIWNYVTSDPKEGIMPFAEKNFYILNSQKEIISVEKDYENAAETQLVLEESLQEKLHISEKFPMSDEMVKAGILPLDSFNQDFEHVFEYLFKTPEIEKVFDKNNSISIIPFNADTLILLEMNQIDYVTTNSPITHEALNTLQKYCDNISEYQIIIDSHDAPKASELILKETEDNILEIEDEFKIFI